MEFSGSGSFIFPPTLKYWCEEEKPKHPTVLFSGDYSTNLKHLTYFLLGHKTSNLSHWHFSPCRWGIPCRVGWGFPLYTKYTPWSKKLVSSKSQRDEDRGLCSIPDICIVQGSRLQTGSWLASLTWRNDSLSWSGYLEVCDRLKDWVPDSFFVT